MVLPETAKEVLVPGLELGFRIINLLFGDPLSQLLTVSLHEHKTCVQGVVKLTLLTIWSPLYEALEHTQGKSQTVFRHQQLNS